MKIDRTLISLAVSMALSAVVMTSVNAAPAVSSPVKHVLLISVDGLHQTDLDWFVQNNPNSTLAAMINNGVYYKNALTPFPSDSFPGLVGQLTGGNPKSAGIYYDDGYSRSELPLGTSKTDCKSGNVGLGAEVQYAENIEPTNAAGQILLDGTQGITGLYPVKKITPGFVDSVNATKILKLAGSPDDVRNILIDPAQLPVDPISCNPVYPHQYLLVNTVFEVAKAAGLRTAWVDKHPAYEILNGPSGYGIDDLFAPEINSVIDLASSKDWTKSNISTQKYDTIHLAAVINEIKGYDHAGINKHGTPAVFGLNFQSVSTAQKLPISATPENSDPTQLGGYKTVGGIAVPGQVLQSALYFIDDSLKQISDAILNNPATQSNTVIILSAKHGQSPQKRTDLTIINDGDMINALNAAWAKNTPSDTLPLVAHAMDDDGVLLWLNNRSETATSFVKNFLNSYSTGAKINDQVVPAGIGSDARGNATVKSFKNAGLSTIYAGVNAANFMGVNPLTDHRVPDVIGIATVGSVYGGSKLSKLAEHGGNSINDRHVPIVAWGANLTGGAVIDSAVSTVQIAPSILALLGLNPEDLKAVKLEGTQVLPALIDK
jgi:Type I phosphodiesterase / nucleotide pyrophosphatase